MYTLSFAFMPCIAEPHRQNWLSLKWYNDGLYCSAEHRTRTSALTSYRHLFQWTGLLHQSPAVVPEAEVISSSEAPLEHLQAVRPSWVNCWHVLFLFLYISHRSVCWFVYLPDQSSVDRTVIVSFSVHLVLPPCCCSGDDNRAEASEQPGWGANYPAPRCA